MRWPHVEMDMADDGPRNEFTDAPKKLYFELWESMRETIDYKTLIVTILSVTTTVLCHLFDVTLNARTDLIGLAVVFPIGVGINGAFKRREDALKSLAWIKGNAFAIRLAYSHWVSDRPSIHELSNQVDNTLKDLFDHLKAYLTSATNDPGLLAPVLRDIAALSRAGEVLRKEEVPPPEISRVNEYIRVISVQFQEMKNIRIYRTPAAMRAYSKFFILFFPILFGPTFNYLSNQVGGIWHGILLAVVYSVILTGLNNVQEALENPFDGVGKDDIQFYEPTFVLHTSID